MKVFATAIHVIIAIVVLVPGLATADEPVIPRVDQVFDAAKEQRIDQLENLSLQAVFEAFGTAEFFYEEDYLNKAIFRTMNYRVDEAIDFALGFCKAGQEQDNAQASRNLYLAKRVFGVFPDEALGGLLDLYAGGGPRTRSKVIYAIGQTAGGPAVKTLLVEALYDESFCQEVTDETLGTPLRICDAAYNQLVIRYQVKDVLRTIGTTHSLDVRDYHIRQLLKKM